MITFYYDRTFPGLLTAIFEAYYQKEKPEKIIAGPDKQQNLFDQTIIIKTDQEKAVRVYLAIKWKISRETLENVFYAFLSEKEEAGTWIYRYLQLGWKLGNKVNLDLVDDRVWKIHNLCRKVKNERHRMLGLIRFRQLGLNQPIFYAPYQPDYNITSLVAPHFAKRLSDQNWIIHDVRRNLAAIYNQKEWALTELSSDQVPPLSEEETACQKLWQEYCHRAAIANRFNPKLQRSNMPMKYWRWLVEMDPDINK